MLLMSLTARESSRDAGSFPHRTAPKEQPPRNLSGKRTAWVDSDALESAVPASGLPPKV
jgi:hypothetical protein